MSKALFLPVAILAYSLLQIPVPTIAQEPIEELTPQSVTEAPPILVVNVAGMDRIRADMEYLFGSVDRKDMIDVVDGLLGGIGNLAGVHKEKPAGFMLFLEPGITPRPVPVVYVPVEDASELITTVGTMQGIVKELDENRYEVKFGERETRYVQLQDGYAFAARDELSLERTLPNPTEFVAALTARYDVAVEFRPESIPPGMRDLLLSLVRTQTQAQLQRRDGEPEAAYAIRKFQGMQNLQSMESILKESRSVTLGLDVSEKSRKAVFELVIEALPDSAFLETIQTLAEEPSRFTPVSKENAIVAFSINAKLNEESVKLHRELFESGEKAVARIYTKMDRGEGLNSRDTATDGFQDVDPIAAAFSERLFQPLNLLLDQGNIDSFAQFRKSESGKFSLLAAIEVPSATDMETPVREILDKALATQEQMSSSIRVEYGAAKAGEISLHRLVPTELSEGVVKVYGEDFGIYYGFEQNVIWFGLGGRETPAIIEQAMNEVRDAGIVERNIHEPPVELIFRGGRFNEVIGESEDSQLREEAFSPGDDSLRMEFRPTETGGRIRVELEEGFIRMLGLTVSRRYDESQL